MSKYNSLLFYTSAADYWEAALPLGNGRIGAMIHGGSRQEKICLNEDTLWSGLPDQKYRENAPANLEISRQMIREKRFAEAEKFISANLLDHDCQSYLPAGNLLLDFDFDGEISNYQRWLDLEKALAVTAFKAANVNYRREFFISYPANLMVCRFTADREKAVSFTAGFTSELQGNAGNNANEIFFDAVCPIHDRRNKIIWQDENGGTGIKFRMHLKISNKNGEVIPNNDGSVTVKNADSVTLYLAIRTDFVNWKTLPGTSGKSPEEKCRIDLATVGNSSFEQLYEEHLQDYQNLFLRSQMEFPPCTSDTLPTPERLQNAQNEELSPNLAALLYNFGRYLMISSSRPGCQPANLQGIWNHLLCPPWASNYTTNINLEMNYWINDPGNLAECAEPLWQMIRECAEKGTVAAKKLFNAPGWFLNHNCDLWRFTAFGTGSPQWAYWPVAGAWLCHHIFERYEFGKDQDFLAGFYDIIRNSAEFLLTLLEKDENGALVSNPSTSPENNFFHPASGETSSVAAGTLMDLSLIRENFQILLDSAKILGKSGNDPLLEKVADALKSLKTPEIGKHGELLEFGSGFDEIEINHRHLSHLYGAYPGNEFTCRKNPQFFAAARKSLERRGDYSTGWAMGWRAILWARYKESEKVCRILQHFLRIVVPGREAEQSGGIYINCFDSHPPFQIDGNFGVAATIAEMLVQSHEKDENGLTIVEIFPALPQHWQSGKVTGINARGGLTIDIEWDKNSAGVTVKTAAAASKFKLICRNNIKTVELKPQESITVTF